MNNDKATEVYSAPAVTELGSITELTQTQLPPKGSIEISFK